MASIKLAYGSATAFTITNANLATSPTAGWQSNAIDSTANLYLDYLIQFKLAAVNTAPAASKAIFAYAFGIDDPATTDYTSVGSGVPGGAEGTLTYADITANPIPAPLLGVIPYPLVNVAINSSLFSIANAFGGIIPPKWAIGMVNNSGMTLSVTSIKYIGVYATVA